MIVEDFHRKYLDPGVYKGSIGGYDYLSQSGDLVTLEEVCIVSSKSHGEIENLKEGYTCIKNLHKINDCRYLNKFLETINSKLLIGGIFIGKFEEYNDRKKRIIPKLIPLNYIVHFNDILFHRLIPKLSVTKQFYFEITHGKGRVLSKAEVFGRLYSCGFDILEEKDEDGELHFTARKIKTPVFDKYPSYGPLIKLRRMGKNGKIINVYKFRTMHPFSEYLQDYIYHKNELQEGGKFKNDFRISKEGQILRKFWIDELPMIINVLKGEMKIVGVRPLSQHYFNLYPKELQEKRIKSKPGLLPPFYADMPKTLAEIIQSELKYLNDYEKTPNRTDWRYFKTILKNILLKGARSK